MKHAFTPNARGASTIFSFKTSLGLSLYQAVCLVCMLCVCVFRVLYSFPVPVIML